MLSGIPNPPFSHIFTLKRITAVFTGTLANLKKPGWLIPERHIKLQP
jgi:hypothetical protein